MNLINGYDGKRAEVFAEILNEILATRLTH
jgi:hypothetical protein